jgi:Rrf2 family protein
MLCLSQTTGYAILALSCLEQGDGENWILAKDIAECTGIPKPYLSKILHSLQGSGLIAAKRGYRGGFALARPSGEISLLEIAEAVEGGDLLSCCLLGLTSCSEDRPCPAHSFWAVERERIREELSSRTLRDVARFERERGGLRLGSCAAPSGRAARRR